MKINYNENEKSIEIKDGLKHQYFVIKTMMGFNIINSIIFPVLVLEKKEMEWFGFIWIAIGVVSLILLIYLVLKKSTAEKLNLSEMSFLKEKEFLGRKRFSLKLNNGKLRDLMNGKNKSDVMELKELLNSAGIKKR